MSNYKRLVKLLKEYNEKKKTVCDEDCIFCDVNCSVCRDYTCLVRDQEAEFGLDCWLKVKR